ncbi:hypothetical protein HUN03_00354 [Mycoplasmopsis anatis]|uniref:hypothetical protein n=1 Tax=Mycoplasmopsis anatis TaxID=171279 RepID=UPI001C4E0E0D|nr:hypothetical protein [Mycoplasmopsis anatis]MBW0595313.1 hypothetical protein [Mycoplasmopsis anatis]MBW0598379.1 hypothetical protein [Mycoplasmopsis anatis]MBW0601848.1 hypothetical protein [Mycoplasmopsis anatis]
MSIEKLKKNKKAIAISSVTASAVTALGLGTFTFLLNQNEKAKHVERYESPFEILKRKRNEILEYITKNGAENTSDLLINFLKEVEALLENQSASIDEVITLVNKIDFELAFENIKSDIRNNQDIDDSVDKLKDLFTDKSIKQTTTELIDQYKNRINSANGIEQKNKLLDELKTLLLDPYKNQNIITEKLKKAMIQAENLLSNSNVKISDSLREQIQSLLDKINSIKNLDANTSDLLADRLLELLQKVKTENDANNLDQIKFENRVNEALKNLENQDLDPNLKEKIKKEINDLLNASKKKPSKENYFSNYEALNKNLDDLIEKTTNSSKSVDELRKIFDDLVSSNFVFRGNEIKEEQSYAKLIQNLQDNIKDDKNNLLESIKTIKQNQNYILGLRIEFDNVSKFVNELVESKLLDPVFVNTLNELLQNNKIEDLDSKELNEVIESDHNELSKFLALVKNEISLNNEIKNQLNDLEELKIKNKTLDDSKIDDLYNEFANLLKKSSANKGIYEEKFNEFNELAEKLRNLHKQELANLIEKTNEFLDKDYISDTLKDKIKQATLVSSPLSKSESPSTVSQIKPKEDLLRQLLKESQRQENQYKYNNKVDQSLDNALNNSNLNNSTVKNADKYKDKIQDYFENAKNEINKINNNDNKENIDKIKEIDKIIEKLQKAEENVKNLDDYVKFVNTVSEEIEKIKDPALRQALKEKINNLRDIIDENYNELNDLENISLSDMKKKLQDALDEFNDLKEIILTNRLYEDTLQKIAYTFINDKDGKEDTPMEAALKRALNLLKDKLNSLEKDSHEYNKTVAQIIDLRDNIEAARELEYRNNQLSNTLYNIPYYDFGDYKPTDVINSAENVYNNTKAYIDTLKNNPEVFYDRISEIKDRTSTVIEKNEALNIEVAQASLRNTINKLEKNKTNLADGVFAKINESIDKLINNSNVYLDKNTPKNSHEINDYNFGISPNIELAQVLKEAQLQLKSLQEKNKDYIASQLESKILENLINLGDNFETIQNKISNLRDEISLIKDKLNLESKLEELKKVFPNNDEFGYRKIYDQAIDKFNKKYDDFYEQYANVNNNSNEIRNIEFNVIKAIEDAKKEKESLEYDWNNLVDRIKKDFTNKDILASDINDFNSYNLDLLKQKFNSLINEMSYPTAEFGDLVELRDKIDFAFNKDRFNTQVDLDIKTLDKLNKNDKESSKYIDDIQSAIDRLNEKVDKLKMPSFDEFCEKTSDSCNSAEYKKQIRELNNKLNESTEIAKEIQPFTEITKEVLDRINFLDLKPNSEVKSDSLKNALENNKIFNLDNLLKDSSGNFIQIFNTETNTYRDKTFDDLTKSEIINDIRSKRDALFKALDDSKTFEERKHDLLERVKQFKTLENQELTVNESKHDSLFSAVFNNTIDKLKEKIEAIQLEYDADGNENSSDLEIKKKELEKFSLELNSLKDASQKLNEASKSVKNAQNTIANVDINSGVQNKLKDVLETLITKQQGNYNYNGSDSSELNSEEISGNIAKINELIDTLSKIQDFDKKYKFVKDNKLSKISTKLVNVLTTNNSLSASSANQIIKNYLESIRQEMDNEVNVDPFEGTINSGKVFELTHILSSFELLIDEIIDKIHKYEEIKNLSDNTILEQRERDMHLWTAKFLGDSIIRSALITNEDRLASNVTIEDLRTLRFTLTSNYEMKNRVYQDRKDKFNELNRQLSDIKNTLNNPVYSEEKNGHKGLLTLLLQNYTVSLDNIAYAGNLEAADKNTSTYTFEQSVTEQVNSLLENFLVINRNSRAIYDQLDRYKSSADLINSLEAADSKFSKLLEEKFQSVEQIKWFTDRTKVLINENKDLWVVNTDAGRLNIKRQELANFILRMDLLFSYSIARDRLESYTADQLTSDELAPLKTIIENLILEIKSDEEPHSEKYYEKLKVKYLTGNGEYSLSRAEFNSLNLHRAIIKAQAEWDEHQRFINSSNPARRETPKMIELYNQLQELLNKAKTNITNPSEVYPFKETVNNKRNEEMKEKLFDAIDNSFDGIIAELKNQKYSELKILLKDARDVKEFITSNYSNVQDSPEINDFVAIAITNLENSNKNNSITEMNNLIIAAQAKIKEQKDKIIKYEIDRTRATNEKVSKYINLFKSNPKYSEVTKIPSELLTKLQTENDKLTSVIASQPSEENYKNFVSYINANIKNALVNVEDAYTSFKTLTTFNLKEAKNGYVLFNQEITNDTKAGSIISLINKLGFKSDLTSKINEFTNSFNSLQTYATDSVLNESDNVTLTFNAYKEYADKVCDVKEKYQNLLFKGTTNIKDKLDGYYEPRKDVNKYLETIRANSNNTTDFAEIIKAYDIQISSVKQIKDVFDDSLSEASRKTINEQIHNIKSAYNSLVKLTEWIKNPTNLEQAFAYLYKPNKNDPSKLNYLYIKSRRDFEDSEFIAEKFIDAVKTQNSVKLTLNNKNYDGILLNSNEALLNYFSEHTIIKNSTGEQIFNNQNIKVYLIKATNQSDYFEQVFQTNPSYKNLRYSIAYVYTNPNKNSPNNVYKDIPDVTYIFNNIETPFMTQKYAKFDINTFKNISSWSYGNGNYDDGPKNWTDADYKSRYVFSYSNAGWTSANALVNMQNALTRGSIDIMKETNKPYVLYDWDDRDRQNLSTARDLIISAKINDNIQIRNDYYYSLRNWTFYSFYNFDNYGDHAWFPTTMVIPMYLKGSNNNQQIALLMIRFEYELSSVKDSQNKFATGFYVNHTSWQKYSTTVIFRTDPHDSKYIILGDDSWETGNKKITDFVEEIMSKNNNKKYTIQGHNGGFDYDRNKFTWRETSDGTQPLAQQKLFKEYLQKFEFKLRLNEDKGEK